MHDTGEYYCLQYLTQQRRNRGINTRSTIFKMADGINTVDIERLKKGEVNLGVSGSYHM